MSKTNSLVSDLDTLFQSLCNVYNGYDNGSLDSKEVTTFIKTSTSMVSVKCQILKEKKFEASLKANKKK